RANWEAAWALFPGTIVYVWHGALHAATVAESLTTQGFTIGAQIIWAKERLVIGRSDYHWQHEPMLERRAIQGQLDRRSQADHALEHCERTGRRDDAWHAETRGVHAPADAEQQQPGPSCVRPFSEQRYDRNRGRDHRQGVLGHGALIHS